MSKKINLGPVTAYAIAVANGFVGTVAEWLASLRGEPGPRGEKGDPGPAGPPYTLPAADAYTLGGVRAEQLSEYEINDIKNVEAKINPYTGRLHVPPLRAVDDGDGNIELRLSWPVF